MAEIVRKSKKNRTTTYESLCGFVGLLFSDSKEKFTYYYKLACKDEGASVWFYINQNKKSI